MEYNFIPNLLEEVAPPPDGILSRTLYEDARLRLVLFGFSAGQELSEHTASVPALIQILAGEARLKLGADSMEARPGACAYMAPHLPHGIRAHTPVVMLLLMMKSPA